MTKNNRISDVLFVFQIICALLLCGSQFFRLLRNVAGQSLSALLMIQVFNALHLALAFGAHKASPSRVTRQVITAYIIWSVLISCDIFAIFYNGKYKWSLNDSVTTIIVLLGGVTVLLWTKIKRLNFSNSVTRGLLAIVVKSMPQFMMIFKIIKEGGGGIAGIAIISGNMSILTRIGQICYAVRESGWNRSLIWLFVSETVNEISWAGVSLAWVFWRFL